MKVDMNDLNAFIQVARAKGFREAARLNSASASALSENVRRLETQLGVRLLNRTTRSVVTTQAGQALLSRIAPAFNEVACALDFVNDFRDKPTGTLKLNVPVSASRLILSPIIPVFLAQYPDIQVDIITDESFVDILAAGCDAGIRYDEKLEKDMVAIPIGPRTQRFAAVAAPSYLERHGQPKHPSDLLHHACIRNRFPSGTMFSWEFQNGNEIVKVDPTGPLIVTPGGGSDLAVEAAIAGTGILYLFEDWLRPYIQNQLLVPILEPWWPSFSGPFLYYPSRRLIPAPLRAFIDFVKHNLSHS